MQNATQGAKAICTKLDGTNNKQDAEKAIHPSKRKKMNNQLIVAWSL